MSDVGDKKQIVNEIKNITDSIYTICEIIFNTSEEVNDWFGAGYPFSDSLDEVNSNIMAWRNDLERTAIKDSLSYAVRCKIAGRHSQE
jgi:hypothetical protein